MGSIISPLTALANAGSTSAAATAANKNHFTTLRDYQHANKIFTRNKSALAPKTKNWFHIYFELDPIALAAVTESLASSADSAASNGRIYWNPNQLAGLGVLAKTVKLPNFKFDVKKANQYNRWNITTTKINYESIDVSFWDDSLDVVRGFWYAYYQYMIQDPNFVNWSSPASYRQGIAVPIEWSPSTDSESSVYSDYGSNSWGSYYGLDTTTNGALNRTNPFFRSIRIYQFNRDFTGPNSSDDKGVKYTEYVLVNPVITGFDHDNVDFATSEFMTNKMSVDYETVLYNSGYLTNTMSDTQDSEIASWDFVRDNFLDNTASPLTGIRQTNNQSQLGSAIISGAQIVTQGVQLATNTGQATASTFLTTVIGSAQSVNNLLTNPSGNPIISVPTVTQGYGTGGQPPSSS